MIHKTLIEAQTKNTYKTMKGQSLVDQAVGIMVATIVLGAVAIPVSADVLITNTQSVSDELDNSSGSVPEIVQADNVFQGLVDGSETLEVNDSLDNTVYTLADSDYTADYETGEFNVTTADIDGDGNNEINSTNDQYLLTYEYKPDGYTGGITGKVLGYIPLALGVGLFVAAISIVR